MYRVRQEGPMRNLIVHEFVTLDGVMQAPGGKDEDRDGGSSTGVGRCPTGTMTLARASAR
jgi:hypothetical protein